MKVAIGGAKGIILTFVEGLVSIAVRRINNSSVPWTGKHCHIMLYSLISVAFYTAVVVMPIFRCLYFSKTLFL